MLAKARFYKALESLFFGLKYSKSLESRWSKWGVFIRASDSVTRSSIQDYL